MLAADKRSEELEEEGFTEFDLAASRPPFVANPLLETATDGAVGLPEVEEKTGIRGLGAGCSARASLLFLHMRGGRSWRRWRGGSGSWRGGGGAAADNGGGNLQKTDRLLRREGASGRRATGALHLGNNSSDSSGLTQFEYIECDRRFFIGDPPFDPGNPDGPIAAMHSGSTPPESTSQQVGRNALTRVCCP